MRVIISGGKGMLGTAFASLPHLPEGISEIIALGRDELDVTNSDSIEKAFRKYSPQLMVHAAAVVDPDIAESNPALAWQINVEASAAIAEHCRKHNCAMAFISTEYVYDGTRTGYYSDSDALTVNPLNVYGKTKLAGEQAVLAICPNALLIRTGLLYGAKTNLVSKTLAAAQNGSPLRAVTDQYSSPTNVRDFAAAILTVAATGNGGVIHIANAGRASRYEFVQAALEIAGMNNTRVEAVRSADLQRPAPRPANTALECSRYHALTGQTLRHWRDALAEYISEWRG